MRSSYFRGEQLGVLGVSSTISTLDPVNINSLKTNF